MDDKSESSTGGVEASDAEGTEMKIISGIAVVMASATSQTIELGHCALMGRAVNQWVLDVKCRPRNMNRIVIWESLSTVCPGAKVEVKHNDVIVTLPSLQEAIEMAVFGTPGENDMKRMQMGIFGGEPKKGKDWHIYTVLYDDTIIAFQQVLQKHQQMGNKLLTARAGLFVSNSDDEIKIELSGLEAAWQIKRSAVQVITSKEAWKPPKNAMDFPTCIFEISHIDEMQLLFFCKITASHVADNAKAEVMAVFKQDAEAIEVKANRKDLEESKHTCDELVFTSSQSEKEIPKTPKLRKQMTTKLHVKIPRVFYILTVILVLSCDLCHAFDSLEPGMLETVNDKNKQQVSIRGCNVECSPCLDGLSVRTPVNSESDGTPVPNGAEMFVNGSLTCKPSWKKNEGSTKRSTATENLAAFIAEYVTQIIMFYMFYGMLHYCGVSSLSRRRQVEAETRHAVTTQQLKTTGQKIIPVSIAEKFFLLMLLELNRTDTQSKTLVSQKRQDEAETGQVILACMLLAYPLLSHAHIVRTAAATTEKEQSMPITKEEARDLHWLLIQGGKEKHYRGISFMFDVLITATPKENASIYAKHQFVDRETKYKQRLLKQSYDFDPQQECFFFRWSTNSEGSFERATITYERHKKNFQMNLRIKQA